MLPLLQLKTLLRVLILPPAGPLLLAVLGLCLLKRRPRLARGCLALGLGCLWLLSTVAVADVLMGWAEQYPPLDLPRAAGAEAVVILGGGGQRAFAPEYGGPAAMPMMLERLSYGAFIARQTQLPVLVTGHQIEATAMRDTLLRNFGIEPRWVDDQAYDTFENARNAARLLEADGIRRVVLVTHANHMRRSVHEFTAAGIDVVPAPVGILSEDESGLWPYIPSPEGLLRSNAAIYELLGEPVRALLAALHLRRH